MNVSRKARRAQALELAQLQREVFGLRCTLDELYARFDRVTEDTQVDACIFEMNAALAKYNYALKCLKAFDFS